MGQQTYASGTNLTQSYDGNGVRAKKVESGATTYYLRSSVLGQQVIAEINGSGSWQRGYVYLGGQLLAIQDSGVLWAHQDPVTKSQRLTNSAGTPVSWVELDPWGGETSRSSNQALQPHRYTTYERDNNNGDEAMFRRYESKWQRFAQPDPYAGSYNLSEPQSLNRYSYVNNDPVNSVDPLGLFNSSATDLSLALTDVGNEMIGGCIDVSGHDICYQEWKFYLYLQETMSSCEKFAAALVDTFDHFGLDTTETGRSLLGQALIGTVTIGSNNQSLVKGKTPFDGFKKQLTGSGQNSDVYRHILFFAGNVLINTRVSKAANAAEMAMDLAQANKGRRESVAELLDNEAGIAVGNAMLNADIRPMPILASRDLQSLTSKITGILCD
jgi:RHS repeat-associated protein